MPASRVRDAAEGNAPEHQSPWRRLRPGRRLSNHDQTPVPFGDRMRNAVLKPAKPGATSAAPPASIDELRAAARSANDKERLIGLVGAPFAAAISFLIIGVLIADDPAAVLKSGRPNPLHVNVSTYEEVLAVLAVLAVVMVVTALLRKRLYLGIVMALYGLAVFNLHYWGFGIPYLMGGSWLLVRAYRLQKDFREATEQGSRSSGGGGRYRPPTHPPTRSSPPRARRAR